MDNIKKALIFVFSIAGLAIFYLVIMVKLEVMAEETQAKIQKMSADVTWEGYLYQKTLDTMSRHQEPVEGSVNGN